MNDSALLETPAADEAAANSPLSQTIVFPRAPSAGESFVPQEPTTMEEAGLSPTDVEALILKQLLISGAATGRKIAEQIKLPFGVMQGLLRGLKQQLLVNYKSQASMGDFEHELTKDGEKRARWYVDRCTYCGSAPVPLREYIRSIERQSIKKVRPKLSDLMNAFSELSLPPATISQVGQAI